MNWIERMFAGGLFATVLAVVLQATIFGFRHSNDLSERSIHGRPHWPGNGYRLRGFWTKPVAAHFCTLRAEYDVHD